MSLFESVSTWMQPCPPHQSAQRDAVIATVADDIVSRSRRRLRVAIDGRSGAGKTSFGHELGVAILARGRSVARASLDDFKNPWREANEKGYDRLTGEGYYTNAYDFASARDLLLQPAGAEGRGDVVLCARDAATGVDHRGVTVALPDDAVLIVDSAFAMRPEYNDLWDIRLWLEVVPDVALQRGIERDAPLEGRDAATRVHVDRYGVAVSLYLGAVRPQDLADWVIDNTDLVSPAIVRRP